MLLTGGELTGGVGRISGAGSSKILVPDATLQIPGRYVSDARDLANAGGLGGVFGIPDFLWVAGDGNTPTIGPTMTVVGTPTVDTTPYVLSDGTPVPAEYYDGASSRVTVSEVDPGANQDVIALVFVNRTKPTTDQAIFGNRITARGWTIFSKFENSA